MDDDDDDDDDDGSDGREVVGGTATDVARFSVLRQTRTVAHLRYKDHPTTTMRQARTIERQQSTTTLNERMNERERARVRHMLARLVSLLDDATRR